MSLALWKSLQNKLKDSLFLENISPQSAILGFTDQNTNANTVNHLLLIFKLFVYKNRSKTLSHNLLFKTIKSTIEIEIKSCTLSARFPKVTKKWENIIHLFFILFLLILSYIFFCCCYFCVIYSHKSFCI